MIGVHCNVMCASMMQLMIVLSSIPNLVIPTIVSNFVHLGCYSTDLTSSFDNGTDIKPSNSPWELCVHHCSSKFAIYVGVQSSKHRCFCGNNLNQDTSTKDESNCSPCKEDVSQWCGGDETLSLYELSIADSSPLLLASDEGVKMLYSIDNSSKLVQLSTTTATSVAYDYSNQEIYFSSGSKILKFPYVPLAMKYIQPETVIVTDCENISDLDLDFIHKFVYWACPQKEEARKCKLDGSSIDLEFYRASGLKYISVNPHQMKAIFFTRGMTLSKIDQWGFNEQSFARKPHIFHSFKKVFRLSIDIHQEVVYMIGSFNEDHERYLVSLNYNYTAFKVVYRGPELTNPYGLDSVNGSIVWVNKVNEDYTIYRGQVSLSKGHLEKLKPIFTGTQKIDDLRIFHPTAQRQSTDSLCQNKNCSHTCLIVSPILVQCRCPKNMVLAEDNQKCTDLSSTTIFFATDEGIQLVTAFDSKIPTKTSPIIKFAASSVVYHYTKQEIYFISGSKIMKSTCSSLMKCSQPIVIIKPDCESLMDLAIDWVKNRLFWVCADKIKAYSANLYGQEITIELVETESLSQIYIEPYTRFRVFLSKMKLSQCYHEDSECKTDILRPYYFNKPLELTIDIQQEMIYVIGSHNNEQSERFLASLNYNATIFRIIYSGPELSDSFGLNVVNGLAVWGNKFDTSNYSLYSSQISPKGHLEKVNVIFTGTQKINDIRLYCPDAQRPSTDYLCQKKGCSYSCLVVSPVLVQCDCTTNMIIAEDNRTCIDIPTTTVTKEPVKPTLQLSFSEDVVSTTDVTFTEDSTESETSDFWTETSESSIEILDTMTSLQMTYHKLESTQPPRITQHQGSSYQPSYISAFILAILILILAFIIPFQIYLAISLRRTNSVLRSHVSYNNPSELVELTYDL